MLTLLVVLALSHWSAPGWLCGVFGAFLGIIWVIWIIEESKNDDYKIDIDKAIELGILKKEE